LILGFHRLQVWQLTTKTTQPQTPGSTTIFLVQNFIKNPSNQRGGMAKLANVSVVCPRDLDSNLCTDRKKLLFFLCPIRIQIFRALTLEHSEYQTSDYQKHLKPNNLEFNLQFVGQFDNWSSFQMENLA
jgi:hypothetical protein